MEKYSAKRYAVYLLSKRDYSEYDLKHKLALKAFSEEEIEQAVDYVQQQNWQSDERFARAFIRYRSRQGYGPRRLKQELRHKGVADWLISQQLDEAEVDWYELAEQLFNKKRPSIWDFKAKQKMWRYMVSHGFDTDHFNHLLKLDYDE